MSTKFLFNLLVFVCLTGTLFAQEKDNTQPTYTGTVTSMKHVTSIASHTDLLPAKTKEIQMMDGRASKNIVVPYKDPQKEDDFFVRNPNPLSQKVSGRTPDLVWEAYTSSSQPTDPDLAVGPNHVFVVFNTGFTIFDKNGVALTGEIAPNPAIFPDDGCCDLTVSYDKPANRWVVSFLGSGAQIAVSDGPDPVNDGWYVYTISQISDYQKLSIWSDGYYMTDNTGATNKVWAMEREQMLLGNTASKIVGFNLPGITTSGFYSPQALNVSNNNMPAAGNAPIVYLQDNAWSGITQDHIKMWLINVNWTTTSLSTISNPQEIVTTPFISVFDNGSFSNLTQPGGGTALDALQATVMNQAQFRKFSDHNSAVFDFVVDTDATTGEMAGIRWIELRQSADGQPWSLYQEGTYTAPDGKHAWSGSIMMDGQGNMGMGYTAMSGPTTSSTVRVSSYYTGRYANDPLGTMTIAEEVIANGTGNIPGTRYGDYNKIDVDPNNDKTFYFINEYYKTSRKGVVGRFQIAPNFSNDIGVISIDTPNDGMLTSSESVSVTIFNYGLNAASNFPVSFQIDGGSIITETYTGTIASAGYGTYTFTTTGNFATEGHTYSILAYTSLSGDENNDNNSATKNVLHKFGKDMGVTAFISPEDGNNLGVLPVTVTISNFGGLAQSNFNVSYTLDANTPVVELVTATVNPGASIDYTFTSNVDLSLFQTYNLSATTLLTADAVPSNDIFSTTITNSSCSASANETDYSIGPNANTTTNSVINIAEDQTITKVTATINLTHTWNSDLDIYLKAPNNTQVELTTDNGSDGDNYNNTIFDDAATTSITLGSAPYTGTYRPEGLLSTFNGLSMMGDWTLIITDDANQDGGTLLNWGLNICYNAPVGIDDEVMNASDLVVAETAPNQYTISWTPDASFRERMNFTVYNTLGQQIVFHRLNNMDGKYTYPLDMTYAPTGVYIIKLGNSNFAKMTRIIVK
jgi:subtilisin-like proprotein convertase family protein